MQLQEEVKEVFVEEDIHEIDNVMLYVVRFVTGVFFWAFLLVFGLLIFNLFI